jgi:hypothetical protein
MDAEKREEIKDLVRMMHAELVKDCPIRVEIELLCAKLEMRGWKIIALVALAGVAGGGASELIGWLKMASMAAQAAGAKP